MKKLFILIVILALVYAGVKLSIPSPDDAIPSATESVAETTSTETSFEEQEGTAPSVLVSHENITVAFTGYGPGKQHDGTVKIKASTLAHTRGVFSGSVTFDMATIATTPDKLVEHLKSKDFFDVAVHPTASFMITGGTTSEIKGTLTIKGVSKPATLPIEWDAVSESYKSTVRVNMEDFGIKQTFADKEFVVTISVK